MSALSTPSRPVRLAARLDGPHGDDHTAAVLPTLSLRALRDTVLAADPGCICDPELFTGPADTEPEDEPAQDRAARIAVAREVCGSCPARSC